MLVNRRVWITGASSGIGKACAVQFVNKGAQIAISGRNESALRQLAQGLSDQQCLVLPFDIRNKSAHLAAAAKIEQVWGGLDIAFLNAGINIHQSFSSDVCEETMFVNYIGMAYRIEAALPLLRKSLDPQLVGMSSVAAYVGMPRLAPYCATKAAIRTLLQGLRIDLKPSGIAVTIVCPGFIRTPLVSQHDFMMPFIMDVDRAAEKIVAGVLKKKREITFPKVVSVSFKLISALPEPLCSWVMNLAAPTHERYRNNRDGQQ